jgi:hypothetical protein
MFHLYNSEPVLEAMQFSVQINYHQQIFMYSPDEYLSNDSFEQHVVEVSQWHRW